MLSLAPDYSGETADYRRRARRIRASFAGDPLLRQRALSQLASERNAQTRMQLEPSPLQTPTRRPAPDLQRLSLAAIEKGFAEHAGAKLQPFGFTFSDRVRLLDTAEKLGISRFRANLILAMCEHQAPGRPVAGRHTPTRWVTPSLLVILGVEVVVLGVLVYVCGG